MVMNDDRTAHLHRQAHMWDRKYIGACKTTGSLMPLGREPFRYELSVLMCAMLVGTAQTASSCHAGREG